MMSSNITLESTLTLVGLLSSQYHSGMCFAVVGLIGSSQRLKVTEWNCFTFVLVITNRLITCQGTKGVNYFDGPVDQA